MTIYQKEGGQCSGEVYVIEAVKGNRHLVKSRNQSANNFIQSRCEEFEEKEVVDKLGETEACIQTSKTG